MTTFLVGTLLVWLVVMAVWFGVSKMFRSADLDKMKSRILDTAEKGKKEKAKKANAAPQLIQKEDLTTGRMIAKLLKRFELSGRVEALLEQAGLKWHPTRLVHLCLALALGGFLAARVLLGIPYISVQCAFGLLLGWLPIFHVIRVRSGRLHKFEEQFPESLEFVARSMRAGHAFSVSLEMLYREFQEPLSGEFRRTFDEHNLGLPLDQALIKLAKRVPLLDVHFFVSAVLLQRRTGGNLAEILDSLATVIRERFKLRGKIKAISAHGRMTGLALTMIPIGVAVLMFYTNPTYISFFVEDETGNIMALIAAGLQGLGYLIIRKIVQIEV
jgi:tight adherence protein B